MSKTESNGTTLSVDMIVKAIKTFKEFDDRPAPLLLPANLYDKRVEQGIITKDNPSYERR